MMERLVATSKTLVRQTSFRVVKVDTHPADGYRIPHFFPHIRNRKDKKLEQRIQKTSRKSELALVDTVFEETEHIGLELGLKDKAVTLLRVGGYNVGETPKNEDLEPKHLKVKIDDGKNRVVFRMAYEIGNIDGEEREWNKVVLRLEQAVLGGRKVDLTPEMEREGFTFLSKDMKNILASASTDSVRPAVVRQETPDASCFIDGHHGSAGKHELGCSCREERQESLAIIHKEGGVSCLMPGTGNGNGSEAQDMQIMIRNGSARRGRPTKDFFEFYRGMGKEEDRRGDTLEIATVIMEHLFRFRELDHIKVLTDSNRKRETWEKHKAGRTITQQQLTSARRDIPDYASKVAGLKYVSAPTMV